MENLETWYFKVKIGVFLENAEYTDCLHVFSIR